MANILDSCTKVRLQFIIDMDGAVEYQAEQLQKLCDIFAFWYEKVSVDEENCVAFFNIYFVNDTMFMHDYSNIIKTFALHGGYFYLGSEIAAYPNWD